MRPVLRLKSCLLGALLACGTLDRALAADADLAAALHPHLITQRSGERSAALRVVLAIGTPVLIDEVVRDYQGVQNVESEEGALLVEVLRGLPQDRLAQLLSGGGGSIATSAARALGEHPDQVVTALQPGGALQGASPQNRNLVIGCALSRAAVESPAHAALLAMRTQVDGGPALLERLRDASDLELDQELISAGANDSRPEAQLAVVDRLSRYTRYPVPPWHRQILFALVRSSIPAVRQAAMGVAGRIITPPLSPEESAQLQAALTDPSPHVRVGAFSWASYSNTVLTENQLLAGLNDPDSSVRCYVPVSPTTATPAMIALLVRMALSNDTCVIGLMGLQRANPAKAADTAYELAMAASSSGLSIFEGLEVLKQNKDPRATEIAARMMRLPDSYLRDQARQVLAASGGLDQDTSALVTMNGDDGELMQQLIALEPDQRQARLQTLYDSLDTEHKLGLMQRMLYSPSGGFADDFLIDCVADADARVAVEAMNALSRPRRAPMDNEPGFLGADAVLLRITDPDPAVAAAAHRFLELLRLPSLLQDVDRQLAAAAPASRDPSTSDPFPDPRPPISRPQDLASRMDGNDHAESLDCSALIQAMAKASDQELPGILMEIGACDDPAAVRALRVACHSKKPALRFTAHLALLCHGDQSDDTCDFAIAYLGGMRGPGEWNGAVFPDLDAHFFSRLSNSDDLDAATRASLATYLHARVGDGTRDTRAALVERRAVVPSQPPWQPADASSATTVQDHAPAIASGQLTHLTAVAWLPGRADGPWEVPTMTRQSDGTTLRLSCTGKAQPIASIELPLPAPVSARFIHLRVRIVSGHHGGIGMGIVLAADQHLYVSDGYPVMNEQDGDTMLFMVDPMSFHRHKDLPTDPYGGLPDDHHITRLLLQLHTHGRPMVVDVLDLSLSDQIR